MWQGDESEVKTNRACWTEYAGDGTVTVHELHLEINTGSCRGSTVGVCSTAGKSEGTAKDSDCYFASVCGEGSVADTAGSADRGHGGT